MAAAVVQRAAPRRRRAGALREVHLNAAPRADDDERKRVLNFIEEIELEVERKCGELERAAEVAVRKINTAVSVQLVKFPKHVRSMTVKEFEAAYGASLTSSQQPTTILATVKQATRASSRATAQTAKRGRPGVVPVATARKRGRGVVPAAAPAATPSARGRAVPAVVATPAHQVTGAASSVPLSCVKTRDGRMVPVFDGMPPPTPGGSTVSLGAANANTVVLALEGGQHVDISNPDTLRSLTHDARREAVARAAALQRQLAALTSSLQDGGEEEGDEFDDL